MARENSNITKRVLMSEVILEDMQEVTIKGLAHECKNLSEEHIRHRARMLKGVKYNIKRSYKDLSCSFCQSGEEETQEHLEVCVGCDFERRGLKMSVRSDIVKFWIRMEKKMVEKKLQEKKEGEKKLQEKKEEEKNRDTVATVT